MAIRGTLAKRIIEKANSRRSPLYLWLHANYSDIVTVMSRPRPSWTALAETAAEAGQIDDEGKQPNANSVRAAWLRVCRDLGKPHGTPARAVPPRPSPAMPKSEKSPVPAAEQDVPDEPPTRHTFRPAKLR